ncbi:MAG: nucleotide exchange factor GrpE [Candidatus Fervidibacter sp.]|uniref:nucleotide exchange factor GrpE n=1 Tax=Candidatus Fervidibacter sp. TaxID=3100871 RepID=UPI00404AEB5E
MSEELQHEEKNEQQTETNIEQPTTEQPTVDVVGEAIEQEVTTEQLKAHIAELERQLAQAQMEANDYKERWIRVSADFQNFRKRVMQERIEAYNKGKEDAVLALLPVLDNMERALSSLTENADLKAFRQGMELIVRLFHDVLKRLDVEPIPSEGQKFDPHYHEAFERVERDDIEDGTIVGVVEQGYKMGDKVIRPAKVRVATKPIPQLAVPETKREADLNASTEPDR